CHLQHESFFLFPISIRVMSPIHPFPFYKKNGISIVDTDERNPQCIDLASTVFYLQRHSRQHLASTSLSTTSRDKSTCTQARDTRSRWTQGKRIRMLPCC